MVDLAATGEEVAAEMVRDPEVRPAVAAERWVGDAAGEQAWEDIVEEYRSRFSSDYRESPDKLRREVRELLGRFGLLGVEDDRLRVHAALARYRPDTEAEIGVAARQNTLTSQLFGDDHS